MGGEWELSCTPGEGSTFAFVLPAPPALAAPEYEPVAVSLDGVDGVTREAVVRYLESYGATLSDMHASLRLAGPDALQSGGEASRTAAVCDDPAEALRVVDRGLASVSLMRPVRRKDLAALLRPDPSRRRPVAGPVPVARSDPAVVREPAGACGRRFRREP